MVARFAATLVVESLDDDSPSEQPPRTNEYAAIAITQVIGMSRT